ncbi:MULTISPECIES: Hpt domain-containing protein [unclassified Pseudomonas]|uniref:Hpt domain-containing protein n=1 Tax=unclassified Pseudomonas TaxID=196821 RepID=UPI001656E6EE|nr:Hpt domain-containing protein [Pseudomonas sp. N40(2020)]MBC8995781.1 Hpt domain-containing protein [Pseudomonas sp. N40(2020)]
MTDEHVDRETLSALRDVMEDSYPELLDTFLTDSKTRLGELKNTVDAKALSDVAHSFKGSASNMGAIRLAELCHELEAQARHKSPSEIALMVADICGEFEQVRPVYEDEQQHSHTH